MRRFTKKHLKKMQAGLKKYRWKKAISRGVIYAKREREIHTPASRLEKKIRPPIRKLAKMPDSELKILSKKFEIYSTAYEKAQDKIEDILREREWKEEEKRLDKLRKVI